MKTIEEFEEQIRALGINSTDTVTVHLSLKSIGEINIKGFNGGDAFITSFRNVLSDGLFLVPSHTWNYVNPLSHFYDVKATFPCVGAVPIAALRIANRAYENGDKTVIRSPHQTHSVIAFGKNAPDYVKDDIMAVTPAPAFGCYGKLVPNNGKILLIGVEQNRNTFLHCVDELLDIPDRLDRDSFPVTSRLLDDTVIKKDCRGHSCYGIPRHDISEYYPWYEPFFIEVGAVTFGKLGDATVRICDAKKCYEAAKELWSRSEGELFQADHPFNWRELLTKPIVRSFKNPF